MPLSHNLQDDKRTWEVSSSGEWFMVCFCLCNVDIMWWHLPFKVIPSTCSKFRLIDEHTVCIDYYGKHLLRWCVVCYLNFSDALYR